MKKLLLVDGSNLLFQMFYGMPSRIINEQGKAIQGTLGFVGALLKIIRRTEPSHVVVLFDGEQENPRTGMDAEYKANRPDFSKFPEEETPFSQLPDIYAALTCLGIKYTETTSCETDDVIAAYALTAGKEMKIVISSFDSDFFQLITDNITVLRYRGDKTVICTREYIKTKFNITPEQYADFKALVGDTADNIKGAEKVGPKTAAGLLQEFGSLEQIIINVEKIGKLSIRDSIIQNTERLRLNDKLIRLNDKAKLPFAVEELCYTDTGMTTNEVLKQIGLK